MGKSRDMKVRLAILRRYPESRQLEALTEAAAGRPEKLESLLAGINAIKAAHPKADKGKP